MRAILPDIAMVLSAFGTDHDKSSGGGTVPMHPRTRLPVVAHWRGQELAVDLADTQPDPDVGSVIHLTVDDAGQLQRRPFKVTGRRQLPEGGGEPSLLARLGFDGDTLPSCIVLDVDDVITDE
jgi:hypothetical protein